jgi:hypothetical protein
VRLKFTNIVLVAAIVAAAGAGGCGEYVRRDNAPVTLVIDDLSAGEGANPQSFFGTLRSDVQTNGSVFDDMGRVTMRMVLKDQGMPGFTNVPGPINRVTITRYRVSFRRSDGRNTPGVDVPFPFESAVTFSVPPEATASATFELIRHTSKAEPPLSSLRNNSPILSTVADVTFSGRDQAGNEASVTGSIGVLFGDFADPDDD